MRAPNLRGSPGRGAPAAPGPTAYFPFPVRALLREELDGEGWHWAIDPYQGCEFGCTFCGARLGAKGFDRWRQFEAEVCVKTNALELLCARVRDPDFALHPVVLGARTDPWQPAEERFRITRSLLDALAALEDVDLRAHTRSSLVARDTDLLKEISQRGHVDVTFSLASLDERIRRLMEPKAPSALRRLSAMEALARAGIAVGIAVSPFLPGLDPEELDLEALLTRASHAGARFAALEFLSFGPGQRENFLAHATTAYPETAVRFRRLVGVKPMAWQEREAVVDAFDEACRRLGLMPVHRSLPARPARTAAPSQLALFPT